MGLPSSPKNPKFIAGFRGGGVLKFSPIYSDMATIIVGLSGQSNFFLVKGGSLKSVVDSSGQ